MRAAETRRCQFSSNHSSSGRRRILNLPFSVSGLANGSRFKEWKWRFKSTGSGWEVRREDSAMQNEQGSKPDHQAFPERLWVFRTGSPEALWAFLAWLNRYGQHIRRRAGDVHTRTVDSTVTAIGTTVFIRLRLQGPQPMGLWPSDVNRRWQQLEGQVIPWIELQAGVACIQPTPRREFGDGVSDGAGVEPRNTEDGGTAMPSLEHSSRPRVEERGPQVGRSRSMVGRRHVLGQTPASRMPRRLGDGRPWSGDLTSQATVTPSPSEDHDVTDEETGRGGGAARCRRQRRRVAQRFAWRGYCGANRLRCRRRVGRTGLRPGLGCR